MQSYWCAAEVEFAILLCSSLLLDSGLLLGLIADMMAVTQLFANQNKWLAIGKHMVDDWSPEGHGGLERGR